MKWIFFSSLFFAIAAFAHSQEKGDIEVRHPWSRATPPGAKVGVGYLEIRNKGSQPDRLLSATTSASKRVEMHVTEHAGEVAKMRQLRAFEIPGRERLELRPGGAHLMLVDDVVTTASTLNACAAALYDGGARILSYMTFARAPASGDRC